MKLDDRRAMNPKLRKAGFEARGLDEAAICQVACDQTDGFISEVTVGVLAAAHGCKRWRKLVDILVEVGRWIPSDEGGEPGWYVHDYLEYNFSKAKWDEIRERKSRAGKASAQHRAEQSVEHSVEHGVEQLVEPSRPVPLVKGGRGLKEPRVAAQPPSFAAADAWHGKACKCERCVPVDPDASAKLRAIRDTLK